MAWIGVESLLRKAKKSAAFQTPFAIANILMELESVCLSFALQATFVDNCPRPLSTARMH